MGARSRFEGPPPDALRAGPAIVWASLAAVSFHAALLSGWGWWIAGFPVALLPLVGLPTARQAFYGGLALGFLLYAPHLGFFWTIFGPAAVVLWGVLAVWVGLFLAVGRVMWRRWPRGALIVALPIVWTGLEYFRSELYPLRFTWLVPGQALIPSQGSSGVLVALLGTYGLGFALFGAGALVHFGARPGRLAGLVLIGLLVTVDVLPLRSTASPRPGGSELYVAGAQTEGVAEPFLTAVLDEVLAAHPEARLLVLPEYSLNGAPDEALREWCRGHGRHLIVGGREVLPGGRFHNTAFVIDDRGQVVFRQAKSVPIQFFNDGLPAGQQRLWSSPWGPVGIAVCYDLSYTRVMDSLVRQGAQLLVVPTMDAVSWGRRQHELHGRIAPLRAAEYGVPIVRLASSGISQWVDGRGRVTATAPFSPETELVGGRVRFSDAGHRPWDRWVAPACTGVTVAAGVGLAAGRILRRRRETERLVSLSKS